jgi:hypothetical protein
MDAMQGFVFLMFDSHGEGDDGRPSKRSVARIREFVCANVDVMTCMATPDGDGYEACDSDGDDDGDGNAPAPSPSSDPMDPATMLANCDVALAVTVSMQLTVDDPEEFVADEKNKVAVEKGIADAAGVDEGDVEAVLTVASRRLQQSLRRLSGGVDVDATIFTEDAAAATAMVALVEDIEPEAMTTAIETAFEEAGLNATVAVASISEPEAQTADQAIAADAAASGTGTAGNSGTANGAHQASITAGVLGTLAVLAATTTM